MSTATLDAEPTTQFDLGDHGQDPAPEPDKPPRRKPGPKPGSSRRRSSAKKPAAGSATIRRTLAELLTTTGGFVQLIGDDYCGGILVARADHVADAYARLADENPRVRRAIESLLQGGVYGGVVLATLSVLVPILAHHGMLPRYVTGLVGAPTVGATAAPQGGHAHEPPYPPAA